MVHDEATRDRAASLATILDGKYRIDRVIGEGLADA